MKLTDKSGSLFNDRIDLELSPSEVQDLKNLFEKKALEAKTYYEQGYWRKFCDYFEQREDAWKEARQTKDAPK